MKPAAERVQAAIAERGLDRRVIELDKTARTSREAAEALGVEVAQIAKSLVFTVNGAPIMVWAAEPGGEGKSAIAGGPSAAPTRPQCGGTGTLSGNPPWACSSCRSGSTQIWAGRLIRGRGVRSAFPYTLDELVRGPGARGRRQAGPAARESP